jgi:hypothetical protein
MAAFAVLGPPDNHLLQGAIERNFERRFFISPGQWVVAETNATAQSISERIGVDGNSGNFVVFSVAGFFGWHRKELWEWLTINSG